MLGLSSTILFKSAGEQPSNFSTQMPTKDCPRRAATTCTPPLAVVILPFEAVLYGWGLEADLVRFLFEGRAAGGVGASESAAAWVSEADAAACAAESSREPADGRAGASPCWVVEACAEESP